MISPAPRQPRLSPSAWSDLSTACPPWVGYPTRCSLPAVLAWSGTAVPPAIGARVHVYLNGFGPAEVMAYFHAEGYLGVICRPDEMPEWFQKQAPGVTLGHFFGRELEPPAPAPAVAAAVPVAVGWRPGYPNHSGYPPHPACSPAPVPFSAATQLLLASQVATVPDVARQMKAGPQRAARLLQEMRERYGPAPTLLHLVLFSGAADLMAMITALRTHSAPAAVSPAPE